MSKSLIGLILIWMVSLPLKAEQPIFNISSLDATHGQIIDVDFHVDNFTNLISVQYSVNWNPAVLKFRAIKNLNAGVPGLNLSSSFNTMPDHVDFGDFTMVWLEPSVTPVTIPDGSLFYTIEFEVLGNPCDLSAVAITGNPTEIEVTEPNEVLVGLIANNGIVTVPGTGCSQDLEVIGNSVTGDCGGNVCVQFTLQNFNDVGVMEFAMIFDSTILQFDKVQNFAPLLGFTAGNTNLAFPGTLKVVWINQNIENESLPDGTVLFEMCFNVIGTGGQSSEITFGHSEITFSDIDDHHYPYSITPASVTAVCALQGFALIADTICTQPDGIVCMDIKVNDFDSIYAMQFSMNWDSTKYTYDHVEAFGIPGFDINGFGQPGDPSVKDGQLLVSWLDLSLQGVTLPDNAVIFRLCLKAVGPLNSSTPIIFSVDPISIEIVNTADSVLDYTLVNGIGYIRTNCGVVPCTVSYTLVPTSPTCAGASTGSLNLDVTISSACQCEPTYLWSYQNATTEDLTNVPAGNYSVTITCNQVIIATATVTEPPPPTVNGVVTNPVPAGSCNGSVNITVTGGTPPFTFVWSSTPPQPTEDLSNVCAGSYTVTITDSNGCVFNPDAFIVGADVTAVVNNVTCNGMCNGSINLTPSFGTGPYTFNWNTTPVQTTEDVSSLCAGNYCVTITDSGGSTHDTCFMVTQPNPLVLSATVTHDINMNCSGAIDLNVTGGTQPYGYSWIGPGTFTATTQDILGLCVGQYCVTVTDGKGCVATNCYSVFADAGLNVALTAQQHNGFQISCNGQCDGVITSMVAGGTPPYTYHWSNNASTANLEGVCAGTYGLTVTDANGQSATSTITLNEPPPLNLEVTVTDPSSPGASDGAASVIVTGGVPVPNYTYLWTGPVTGNTAALNNLPGGNYTILVTDGNGCQESEEVTVGIPPGACHKGMAVFTPNSDGKNDFFVINCVNDPNHLYIFNRQGGLTYETDNYQNNWIGVDNDDEPVPDGGYLWVLVEFGSNGIEQVYKGTVVLLRTAD